MEVSRHMDLAQPIEILKPGRATDNSGQELNFTSEDLKALAEGYDPSTDPAPIVVGHPKTDDPAYGWLSDIKFDGSRLTAVRDQVEPQFAQMVDDGRFKKVSLSLFPPNHPNNPKPGIWYPKHLGYLGAAGPAIKGLRNADLSEDDDQVVTVELHERFLMRQLFGVVRRLVNNVRAREGNEAAAEILSDHEQEMIEDEIRRPEPDTEPLEPSFAENTEEDPMSNDKTADLAAQQEEIDRQRAELEQQQNELATERKTLADARRAARRASHVEFADGLAKQGRILPRHKPMLAEILLSVEEIEGTVDFAEGSEVKTLKPVEAFKSFLNDLPEAIDFSEKSSDADSRVTVNFSAPEGKTVDMSDASDFVRVKQYMDKHNVDINTAHRAVIGG